MTLPAALSAIIICPKCHSSLVEAADELTCQGCGLIFPIRDGIPVLLVDEARQA